MGSLAKLVSIRGLLRRRFCRYDGAGASRFRVLSCSTSLRKQWRSGRGSHQTVSHRWKSLATCTKDSDPRSVDGALLRDRVRRGPREDVLLPVGALREFRNDQNARRGRPLIVRTLAPASYRSTLRTPGRKPAEVVREVQELPNQFLSVIGIFESVASRARCRHAHHTKILYLLYCFKSSFFSNSEKFP